MIKVVAPDSFSFDQPTMSLMDVHSRGVDKSWLLKSAAVLTQEMADLKPEKGTTFVHMIALGDSETYGANRNGDLFTKDANEKYHHTFVKHAKWYHNHKNKPHLGHPDFGYVKMSAYNPEMQRVELVVAIDDKKDPDSIQKLASGKDLPVSMACSVPFDICTICDNKASKPTEYCQHIKEAVTKFTDDGRQVGMINTQPKFFDISKVHRNADRIAFSLRKVAGVQEVMLSVDAAKMWGLTEADDVAYDPRTRGRMDLLHKLANVESQISAELSTDISMRHIASAIQNTPCEIGTVQQSELQGVLCKLASARVCLPIEDFFRTVMGSRFSEVSADIGSAKTAMVNMFNSANESPADFLAGVDNYETVDKHVPNLLKRAVEKVARTSSLDAGPVGGRVQLSILNNKQASSVLRVPVTPAGKCLAEEYARYKFAFIEQQDPFVTKMAILQNFG